MKNIHFKRKSNLRWDRCFAFDTFSDYETAGKAVRERLGIKRLNTALATEVREAVEKHTTRQSNRYQETLVRGKYLKIQEQKRREFALAVGKSYHNSIHQLFQSYKGDVLYGEGGKGCVDKSSYYVMGNSYSYYLNGGARLKKTNGEYVVILENYRGTEKARITFAPELYRDYLRGDLVFSDDSATLQGDLYAVRCHGQVWERYNHKHKKTGFAIQVLRLSQWRNSVELEWEHGETLDECRVENERKIALREQAWAEKEGKTAEEARAYQKRLVKAASRVARFCPNLPVSFTDAREAGACIAGIKAWAKRRGYTLEQTVPLSVLQRDTDSYARRVADVIVTREAKNLISKRVM